MCTIDSCGEIGCTHTFRTDCDDNNACTQNACHPITGCFYYDFPCDDGDACTVDGCGITTGCTFTPRDCNDGDACTADSCDSGSGCINTQISCSDGDPCTVDGVCLPSSGCVYPPIVCTDDLNPCTVDACVGGLCPYTPGNAGVVCHASTGECDPEEVCDGASATCPSDVVHADGTPCSTDENTCTTDVCTAGVCAHPALPDYTACTSVCGPLPHCLDATCVCLPTTGCTINCTLSQGYFSTHSPNDAPKVDPVWALPEVSGATLCGYTYQTILEAATNDPRFGKNWLKLAQQWITTRLTTLRFQCEAFTPAAVGTAYYGAIDALAVCGSSTALQNTYAGVLAKYNKGDYTKQGGPPHCDETAMWNAVQVATHGGGGGASIVVFVSVGACCLFLCILVLIVLLCYWRPYGVVGRPVLVAAELDERPDATQSLVPRAEPTVHWA